MRIVHITHVIAGALFSAIPCANAESEPPGRDPTLKTRALEAGAAILQTNAPLRQLDVHMNGFHPLKDEPAHQMEAAHFCNQVNEDFAQCVLFDGDGKDAKLNGIEYIISERLFQSLPENERRYWHPHNYEILSGQLVAPNLPDAAELEFLEGKMNSYGKTWHVWNTGMPGVEGDELPLGDARLAWSFNRDGEAKPGLVEQRDQRLGIDAADKRRERAKLRDLAHEQEGADALQGKFGPPSAPHR